MKRMALWRLALPIVLLPACRQGAPARGDEAAETQAALATDSTQARLWRGVTAAAPLDLQALRLDSQAVRPGARSPAPERPTPQGPDQPFPQSVEAAIAIVDAPAVDPPFSGTARVTAAAGEYLSLDLGDGRAIRVHAKVGGGALRTRTGEEGRIFFSHQGDPMVAGDRLALRLAEDDLLYALVGGSGLVAVAFPPFRLTARQTEPIEANTSPVRLTVGTETQTVRHGETATFATGNLTVRVLASIAVQGEAANALPGEPFRLQLLGWRTRPQR